MASTLNDEDLSISLPSYERDSSAERDRDRDRDRDKNKDRPRRRNSQSHSHSHPRPPTTTNIPQRDPPFSRQYQHQNMNVHNPNSAQQSPATLRDMQRLDQYTTIRILGEGSFGKVKLAVHRASGRQVALKIIPRRKLQSRDMVGRVEREIQYLQLLRHPHIIKL